MGTVHRPSFANSLLVSNVVLTAIVLWQSGVGRRIMRLCRQLWPVQQAMQTSPPRVKRAGSLKSFLGQDYEPPLPKPVADALERSRLCFLATAGCATSDTLEPHLSLMRFTYARGLEEPDSEVMVISTRRDTKKFQIITENHNVALLVHDFDTGAGGDAANYIQIDSTTRYSITLNGTVKVQQGELAERYRAVHLANNPSYSQFIVGEDIAIVTVHLTRARVCDVNDRVSHFARDQSGKAWTEVAAPPASA